MSIQLPFFTQLTGLADPIQNDDAATKAYVDRMPGGGIDSDAARIIADNEIRNRIIGGVDITITYDEQGRTVINGQASGGGSNVPYIAFTVVNSGAGQTFIGSPIGLYDSDTLLNVDRNGVGLQPVVDFTKIGNTLFVNSYLNAGDLIEIRAKAAGGSGGGGGGAVDSVSLNGGPALTGAVALTQANVDWNAASGVTQILNKPNLATVATSGSYTDLSNRPTIPAAQVNSDWNAVSGVAQILNRPAVGAANGLATLDASGKLPTTQLPNLAITHTFVVASQAEMLALVAEVGDVAIRTDVATTFILRVEPATTLSNWQQLPVPAQAVNSVSLNGGTALTGAVALTQANADWNAASGVTRILNKPTLATVATSGSYNDLSNRPTIPAAQVNSDWNAASGVARILNKPSVGTNASGNKTISASTPTGGSNGDVWYQV